MAKLNLTDKQIEYVRSAHARWNFAVGAVRSGKSYLATLYTIPKHVIAGHGKQGLNLILGATSETIERNVLAPMRNLYGAQLVGEVRGSTRTHLFNEEVYCIGSEKVTQVSKLRGSEIKFCYIDEACDTHPDLFDLLKSRLSLPYSTCHAACNPASPGHYIKRFIDQAQELGSGIDLYYQHYTLYDNPYLPESYVHALEAEYAGTVYERRYIWGEWAQAEGLVYPMFEQALEEPYAGEAAETVISLDYGTQNALHALLWTRDRAGVWHVTDEFRYSGREEGRQRTDEDYVNDMLGFAASIKGEVEVIIDPSAASFITALRRCRSRSFRVRQADNDVPDGIRDTAVALQTGAVRISRECKHLVHEFEGYVWDDKASDDRPIKRDDHGMDALRYFIRTRRLCRRR